MSEPLDRRSPSRAWRRAVAIFVAACGASACGPHPSGVGDPCMHDSDCVQGLMCISNACTARQTDAPLNDAVDLVSEEVVLDAPPDMADIPIDTQDVSDVMDVPTDADATMPPGDACPLPVPDGAICFGHTPNTVHLGATQCGVIGDGMSFVSSSACQAQTDGPEDIWTLDLAAASGVTFTVAASTDLVISVRDGCTMSSATLGCGESQGSMFAPFVRLPLAAGSYVIVVDEFGTPAQDLGYTLTTGTYTPASNATCSNPIALVASLTSQLIGAGSTWPRPCGTTDTGPALFYSVSVPAGMSVDVTATPTSSDWRPFLHAFSGCSAPITCLGDSEAIMPGGAATLRLHNGGPSAASYIVAAAASEEPVPMGASFGITVAPAL